MSVANSPKETAKRFFGDHGLWSMWPWALTLLLVWILQTGVIPSVGADKQDILVYAGIYIIMAVSLNLVNGFTGQFSMGHAGFMAVGAYVSAFLSLKFADQPLFQDPNLQAYGFIAITLAAGFVSMIMGYLVGLPSLRLKGDYLAIVTLGFGEIIRVVLLNMDSVGGARGLPGIPIYSNFGWVYSWAIVTVFVIWRVVKSSQGRELLAVREDEIAAESMGVNTTQAKVRAFALGAFFAGVAGGLFAHYLSMVVPSSFDFNRSFEIIIMVVLGGMGSISGSVFAAIILTFLREYLRELQELRMIIYSLLLIIMMLTRPNGLFGTREIFDFLPRRKKTTSTDLSKESNKGAV